ncbi:MAG: extracellular solute-binding protein [Dehalococcoidia bacterium]|nr:extracellular solute-binding protein [Dehalococcoidia bacterium]
MKRFHHSLLSVLLLSVVLVAACASPKAPVPATAPAPTAGQVPSAPQLTEEQQLYEAAKKEGELIIWTNTWQHGVIEKAFMEKYPGIKVTVWDGPTGAALVSQILEEAKAGKTSVDFLSASAEDMPPLVEAGLLREYSWPNAQGFPGQPPHKFYLNHSVTTRAPIYNSRLVAPAEVPRSWDALKSQRWAGKSVLSTSGTDSTLMFAYMWREGNKLAWEQATKFWKDVRAVTRPQIASGFSTNIDLLAAGEYDIFLLCSLGEVFIRKWKGAPVEIAPVGGKLPATARSVGILKNAPHPAGAQLFADFFTEARTLASYSDAVAVLSLSPEARKISKIAREFERAGLDVEVIPLEFATEQNLRESVRLWREITSLR